VPPLHRPPTRYGYGVRGNVKPAGVRIVTVCVGVDDVACAVREDGSGAWLGWSDLHGDVSVNWPAVPWVRPFAVPVQPVPRTPHKVHGVYLDTMERVVDDPLGFPVCVSATPEDL